MNGKATFRKNGGSAMKNTYERLNNGKSTFLPLPDLPKIPLPLPLPIPGWPTRR